MKGKAALYYGLDKGFTIEELPVPEVEPGGILVKVTAAAICGSDLHFWRGDFEFPESRLPRIPGHEFCGEIVEVGAKWADQFKAGEKFSIQPALVDENGPVGVLSAPGYSYKFIGGDSQYVIIPEEVMIGVLAIGNFVLRFFTTKPLAEK